jgi:hypothetical protein
MTEAKIPDHLEIPSREEEHPVKTFNGVVLAHEMTICRPEHLWPKGMDELRQHPDWFEAIERYLAAFADPIRTIANEIKCPACGIQVTGHPMSPSAWKYFGSIKHSSEGTMEGRCGECGYPCRLKHEIKMGEILLVRLTQFPLFYHPDVCAQST